MLKINGKVAERPQHMLMRVAIGIHGSDIDSAIEVCYSVLLNTQCTGFFQNNALKFSFIVRSEFLIYSVV